MNPKFQTVDLFSPMLSSRKGKPPLVIRIGVQDQDVYTTGGPQVSPIKPEPYVLLSALPEDLRKKVETAIQVITTSI
jgi:hypothetical protein